LTTAATKKATNECQSIDGRSRWFPGAGYINIDGELEAVLIRRGRLAMLTDGDYLGFAWITDDFDIEFSNAIITSSIPWTTYVKNNGITIPQELNAISELLGVPVDAETVVVVLQAVARTIDKLRSNFKVLREIQSCN
jgi:hypothetical protein